MNVIENDLYDARYLTRTDKRFEAMGIPRDLLIFDPAVYHNDFGGKSPVSEQGNVLMSVWDFQRQRRSTANLLTRSVSLQMARRVVEYKTDCSARGVRAGHDYFYLYSVEFRGWHHHFFRDKTVGTTLSLITEHLFQSETAVLCVDGRKVLTHICEENRPGEKTEGYTGLSLEVLLEYIDHHIPLLLSGKYFEIMEVLGEGFESVVFKVRNCSSGAMSALKLGKLALESNYRSLQPLLPVIKQSGISVPHYISYDPHMNGILMEYSEGERFASSIERMKQEKKTRSDVFKIYATCLSHLITLQSTFSLSHGDAHEENWLVKGSTPVLIDFRHSLTVPFTSSIYRHRDVFAMLCTLYRLVYGSHPANRQEVKQAIMQQRSYHVEHSDAFPPFQHGNRYDRLLHQFLRRSVYNPYACSLQDIAHIVEIYRSGFY